MQYGQQNIGGHWYLFDKVTGAMKTGFQYIADQHKTVYYNKDGQMLYGFQKIGEATYYFDPALGTKATGQKNIKGHWYYFNGSGVMATGFTYLPDQKKWVYYNDQGQMLYGFQKIKDATYYFDPALGTRATGQKNIKGHWYYFNPNTGAMATGLTYLADQKKTVYYADNGQMQYGAQVINGTEKFFDVHTGALITAGIVYDAKAHTLKYYDAGGDLKTGLVKIDGQMYTFDQKTGHLVVPKEQFVSIKGATYLLNQAVVLTGWQNFNKQTYYFDLATAKMVKGEKQIANHWYLFDVNNGAMKTGFQYLKVGNKTVYYANDGQMQYGQQNIGGHWYYFDKGTGKMATGLTYLADQNKTVYYNNQGQMQYGQQNLGGHWYYFDDVSGAMKTGFYWIDSQHKTVYYAGNGQMQYGWQQIGHYYYFFDRGSGAMFTGVRNIDGRRYTFNNNGVLQNFTQRVIDWFLARDGRLTYSMMGSRNGSDGTADCSGGMTEALWRAGASTPDATARRWGGYNTVSIRPYLRANGYVNITNNGYGYSPQYGDIVIWGDGLGDAGHIMIISSGSGNDAKEISVCGYAHDADGRNSYHQAIKEFNYNWYWADDEHPSVHVYRLGSVINK